MLIIDCDLDLQAGNETKERWMGTLERWRIQTGAVHPRSRGRSCAATLKQNAAGQHWTGFVQKLT